MTPVLGPHNRSVEVFYPVTNSWTLTSDFNDTPEGIATIDYTHVYQFPIDHVDEHSGTRYDVVMMLGGSAEPFLLFMNGKQSIWRPSRNLRPGAQQFKDQHLKDDTAPIKIQPNHCSSGAMLPIRLPEASWGYTQGSVINVGGETGSSMEGNIDVYEPVQNQWRPSIPMIGRRCHPNVTILPDGRMLILAGYADNGSDQTGYAEYVDPKNNFAHSVGVARMPEIRGYHSMVVLLPDGRVFVGGGNNNGKGGNERPNFRYYYPDYMFKERPKILSVQRVIKINNAFSVFVPYLTSVDEVSLLALGAMTHSFDMSQRSVQLRLSPTHTTVKLEAGKPVPVDLSQCMDHGEVMRANTCHDLYFVQAPSSPNLAPPGHYMLFVLDKNRVPSIGEIVKLEP